MPSEYLATGFLSSGSSPTRRMARAMPARSTRRFSAASASRLRTPERAGKNPGVSMIAPRSGGKSTSRPTRRPPTMTSPSVGGRKPQMHFISTVLPLPLLPTIPWILPASKSRVTPWSTRSRPKSRDRFLMRTAASIAIHSPFLKS